MHMFFSQILA